MALDEPDAYRSRQGKPSEKDQPALPDFEDGPWPRQVIPIGDQDIEQTGTDDAGYQEIEPKIQYLLPI
jgi:hypothetical protein